MIPDQLLERFNKASKKTEAQLRTIERLEGSIDEKVRVVIRQNVVDEIDGIVKQLKEGVYPGIDLENLTPYARDRFDQETWIEGYPTGVLPIYRLVVHTTRPILLTYPMDKGRSSAYLPADVFMKMITDLKTSITKGEMDKQIQSRTDNIIYTRMRQVQETLIPEWKKQEDPQYKREKAQLRVIANIARSLARAKGANESQRAN